MANQRAKAERSAFKDARQMPAPDQEPKRKRKTKRHKPYRLEHRYTEPLWGTHTKYDEWTVWGRYETSEIAEKVKADLERKSSALNEYRIVHG